MEGGLHPLRDSSQFALKKVPAMTRFHSFTFNSLKVSEQFNLRAGIHYTILGCPREKISNIYNNGGDFFGRCS